LSITPTINDKVKDVFLSLLITYPKQFKPTLVGKSKVYQELIFPIYFNFKTQNVSRNFFFSQMFQLQNQMYDDMMHDIQMQRIQEMAPTFPHY